MLLPSLRNLICMNIIVPADIDELSLGSLTKAYIEHDMSHGSLATSVD